MIDQKLFRDKPEIVRNMLKNRNVEIDISKLLEIDQERRAIITEVTKEYIVIDMNHPLAGKTLTFSIKLVKISH